jgi:hypothetical protein
MLLPYPAYSMNGTEPKKAGTLLVYGLLPGVIVTGVALLFALATRPPSHLARAALVVDWSQMPSVHGDDDAQKLREAWREEIIADTIALPKSDKLQEFLDADEKLGGQSLSAGEVRQWLRVTLVAQTNDCDCFAIKFRSNDASLAKEVVKCVLDSTVSDLNTESRLGGLLAVARSKQNQDDLKEQEEQRRKSGEDESVALELQQFGAGLDALSNLVGLFGSPVRRVQEAHVENFNGIGEVVTLLVCLVLGGAAGVAGLQCRKLIVKTGKPKPAGGNTSAIPPKLPITAPPIISRRQPSKPPILSPPVIYR